MKRLALIAVAVAAGFAFAGPAGACAASADDPCFHDPLVATVTGEIWWDYNANGVRDADEHPAYLNTGEIWADYNHDGVRQEGEAMVTSGADGSYSLPVDTRRLAAGATRVDVRFRFQRYPDLDDAYDPRCVAPAAGCVRSVDVVADQTTPGITFPAVGVAQLNGMIWDDKNDDGHRQAGEDGVPHLRVFLDDNGNGKLDPGEPASYKTNVSGMYIFPIPTRYQAAGGNLPPLVLEEAPGADCSAPDNCAVTGLHTRTGQVTVADHGVARPVVIFIHGYGGSQIVCPGKLMWFNALGGPDLYDMRLGEDGQNLREGVDGGTSCSEHASVDGLVKAVAGADIYGGASDHFESITWPGRHYDYAWDWRNSPDTAVAGLDALVEKARAATGVARVQLVAHSMGGLVIREYIENPSYAAKVQRVVTVGTPYWGSPKTIFPLAAGTEVPYFSKMDILMSNAGLKASSRTFPGHFALMPAYGYGPWLSVGGMNGGHPLDMDGLREYLRRIGVDPAMYTRAAAEHGRVLDHYDDHGIDYEVIVGGGVPTMRSVGLSYGLDGENAATVNWVSGDKTVPMFSAAMDTPRDRLHVVCGVEHVPITTNPQTTRLMDGFLIRGDRMRDEQSDCPWEARELSVYYPDSLTPMASASSVSGSASRA